jgi:hypothetical protein
LLFIAFIQIFYLFFLFTRHILNYHNIFFKFIVAIFYLKKNSFSTKTKKKKQNHWPVESVKALFSHFTLKSLQVIAALQKKNLIKWNLHKTQATVDFPAINHLKWLKCKMCWKKTYKLAKISKFHMSKGHSNQKEHLMILLRPEGCLEVNNIF